MASVLVLHGPNLNLLGTREPERYGHETLDDINQMLSQLAESAGLGFATLQANSEADLIERIHATRHDDTAFLLFNPGAFTHTSIALRDAILAVELPFIELHLSNIHQREAFRHQSFFADIAEGVIAGFGANSYALAMTAAIDLIQQRNIE
ncbi:MAG: type II 3-dehydroquinate dehydratase [Pseudomonadales bacterium]|nr:type II 3-dehydroquinate dehydratase [Pseudomonadales bacterium]